MGAVAGVAKVVCEHSAHPFVREEPLYFWNFLRGNPDTEENRSLRTAEFCFQVRLPNYTEDDGGPLGSRISP